MGCNGSTATVTVWENKTLLTNPHRMTKLNYATKVSTKEVISLTEEDHQLIGADVLELLKVRSDSFALGFACSKDDPNLSKSYQEKESGSKGKMIFPPGNIGHVCKKGLKPTSPNQDSWCVLIAENDVALYGVFDGHGENGHRASQFVMEMLPKIILMDDRFRTDHLPSVFADAFERMQVLLTKFAARENYSVDLSGSTATIVVHDFVAGRLTTAHVGDSCCSVEGKMLTRVHKPNDPLEKKRILAAGGRVEFDGCFNYRVFAAKPSVYPGMNMSRAFGDVLGHRDAGIVATPTVFVHKLREQDKTLLVCSDGVWEFLNPTEALDIVRKAGGVDDAAESLAKKSWDLWMEDQGGHCCDDITAIVVNLSSSKP